MATSIFTMVGPIKRQNSSEFEQTPTCFRSWITDDESVIALILAVKIIF